MDDPAKLGDDQRRMHIEGPRILPYRLRLWWAKRSMPVCHCENPAQAPPFHDVGCPVREAGATPYERHQARATPKMNATWPCESCGGSGTFHFRRGDEPCPECAGQGQMHMCEKCGVNPVPTDLPYCWMCLA